MNHRRVLFKKQKQKQKTLKNFISNKNSSKNSFKHITKHITKNITKKHITKKHITNNLCAPSIEPMLLSDSHELTNTNINIIKSASDASCFTIDALRKIADKWNESNPSMKIQYNDITTGKSLWNSINNAINTSLYNTSNTSNTSNTTSSNIGNGNISNNNGNNGNNGNNSIGSESTSNETKKCTDEVCWIKQDFIKYSPLYKTLLKNFKPLMPIEWHSKPTEWLNTLDIRNVMTQYENKYPTFEFIGPVPMDFDTKIGFGQCVIDELCKIDLQQLIEKNKTNIGVIFNLDKHTQQGSHWVAMHCSIDNNEIYYWDSYGMKPEKEVVILMNRLKQQGLKIGHNIKIKINNVRHQYKNSECGVYCIYFLTSLLDGKTFNNIINNIIDDDTMNAKRNSYFIKH